ncbi:peptidyl-prolyl cis-trans isomerase FKBP15-2-like [Primulina huaijiensis]|uniref:peptidyl-prolyl cis-trans isomerase FKBP15-2-like n=1 Tax=Primulina huaijiensis TaxID=1492673 RepID=UPI003CC71A80
MGSKFVLKAALIFLVFSSIASAKKSVDVTELQIGVKYKPKICEVQAHKGDNVKVHYRVSGITASLLPSPIPPFPTPRIARKYSHLLHKLKSKSSTIFKSI